MAMPRLQASFMPVILLLTILSPVYGEHDKDIVLPEHSRYITQGYGHIIGELHNQSSEKAYEACDVFVEGYDSNNHVIATDSARTEIDYIAPGGMSPYDIRVARDIIFESITKFEFRTDCLQAMDKKPNFLEITNVQLTKMKEFDAIRFDGDIINNGNDVAELVEIAGSLYDDKGRIIAVSHAFVTAPTLGVDDVAPHSSTSFTIFFDTSAEPADYKLVVDSLNYAEVPEFPINLMTVTAIGLIGVIIVLRLKSQKFGIQ